MLKLRLQRIGRKNNPSYRVIVTDSRNAPSRGRHVSIVGSYEPFSGKFQVDAAEVREWISRGVQVSDTVHNLLVTHKVIEGKKKNALPRKAPIIDEAAQKAAALAAEKAAEAAQTIAATPDSEPAATA